MVPPPKRKSPTAMLYGEVDRMNLPRGMEQMTRLLRPALGPVVLAGAVASLLHGAPEILDDGATITRLTIELADPWEAGLLDSAAGLAAALDGGVSAATTVLAGEALFHRPDSTPSCSA